MVLASVAFTSIALVWFSATEAVALEEMLGVVVSMTSAWAAAKLVAILKLDILLLDASLSVPADSAILLTVKPLLVSPS